ncbi:hypothetical protein DB88DRAFT_473353 [Papiliotrema laurentii]|uniref:Uncharacterized protein n=1 Tax=Papiliotrema laurentii TaxID=5418 RepID=A0AAD9D0C1_PAPLA|nr:hypothetical protein DB88DRAFT_473353 [Papiliotrema laurentii]
MVSTSRAPSSSSLEVPPEATFPHFQSGFEELCDATWSIVAGKNPYLDRLKESQGIWAHRYCGNKSLPPAECDTSQMTASANNGLKIPSRKGLVRWLGRCVDSFGARFNVRSKVSVKANSQAVRKSVEEPARELDNCTDVTGGMTGSCSMDVNTWQDEESQIIDSIVGLVTCFHQQNSGAEYWTAKHLKHLAEKTEKRAVTEFEHHITQGTSFSGSQLRQWRRAYLASELLTRITHPKDTANLIELDKNKLGQELWEQLTEDLQEWRELIAQKQEKQKDHQGRSKASSHDLLMDWVTAQSRRLLLEGILDPNKNVNLGVGSSIRANPN